MILNILLQFILFISVIRGNKCPSKFSSLCSCGETEYLNKRQYVVNCTNTGFNNSNMLQYLPNETEVLIFTGNNIKELPWNIFGTLNSNTQLKVIDMSNNRIQEIRGKSYHRVSNVERLILNYNQISISSGEPNHHHPRVFSNFDNLEELHLTDAFADNSPEDLASDLHDIFVNSDLTQLRKLHLEQNEISQFQDRRVFCDLPSLEELYLGQNLLEGIHFELSCLKKLHFLDLEVNNIHTLQDNDLDALDSIAKHNQTLKIDISQNPLSCRCENFYTWLQNTKVVVRQKSPLHCPVHSDNPIVCASHLTAASPVPVEQHSDSGLIFFLTLALCITLGLLIYTNKEAIKLHSYYLFQAVTKKVRYTNIGSKQEEQEMDV